MNSNELFETEYFHFTNIVAPKIYCGVPSDIFNDDILTELCCYSRRLNMRRDHHYHNILKDGIDNTIFIEFIDMC